MQSSTYQVIVIGAGHAGLSVSYFLSKANVKHIVFEKGKIGETWRSQRWDSFVLNTPNEVNILPGDEYNGENPDGFFLTRDFVNTLETYAIKFRLPVRENAAVISLEKEHDSDRFELIVSENGSFNNYSAAQVIIASGIMNEKKIPPCANGISSGVAQFHAKEYKNPRQLPEGAILVVGSGQSGCQITEDLLNAGRKVYLSTSNVSRVPRRYRGKDIFEWLILMKFVDTKPEDLPDPRMMTMPQPQVSGVGRFGHTVSLQYLFKKGATILGKLEVADHGELVFEQNAADHVKFADGFSHMVKEMIDDFIRRSGMVAPPNTFDEGDEPDPTASCVSSITHLNLDEHNIRSIVWTTGFTADFNWLHLSVFDEHGNPKHNNGISEINGLYFIGFPWLRSRKSGIIYGIKEDAEFVVQQILKNTGSIDVN